MKMISVVEPFHPAMTRSIVGMMRDRSTDASTNHSSVSNASQYSLLLLARGRPSSGKVLPNIQETLTRLSVLPWSTSLTARDW